MSTNSKDTEPPDEGNDPSSDGLTCYRHPGRETGVRCTRCDRPICPDCMREATVGFQCPECVREGGRTVREARTVFGGRVHAINGVVTWVLVAANVAMYGLQLAVSGSGLVYRLGLQPLAIATGEWWRLFTSAFLHSPQSLFHIAFNMLALIVLGPQLEALLGRLRFAVVYGLSALGGAALSYATGSLFLLAYGASGAIFGIFGAVLVVARRLQLDTRWILGLLAVNLVITFTAANIGWRAHIGGLVTGIALALAYAYAPRSSRTAVHITVSSGVAVLIGAVIVLRTLTIPV